MPWRSKEEREYHTSFWPLGGQKEIPGPLKPDCLRSHLRILLCTPFGKGIIYRIYFILQVYMDEIHNDSIVKQ